MTHIESTNRWYLSFVEGLIVMALFSSPMLAVMDGITSALCLPRFCSKGGALTLWGLLVNTIIVIAVFRFVPLI
jgi:hypothetical protein